MIVVVADDFTGAAEVAGLGLMHNLTVELNIEGIWSYGADLLVIATDTRSKMLEDALEEIRSISLNIDRQKPLWVFKKIDSVLRGHIIEETRSMIDSLKMKGAIIVPANPAMGRIIIDGNYYIDGKLLESTGFSEDPEFKTNTSSVKSMLQKNGTTTYFEIIKSEEFTGQGNIIVGEASTTRDLDAWAQKANANWLMAGAAEFFRALLIYHGMHQINGNHTSSLPENVNTLYLCGSTFQESRDQVTRALNATPYVCYMPEDLFWKHNDYESKFGEWLNTVVKTISQYNKAIVAVRELVVPDPVKAAWIKHNFAYLVREIFTRIPIGELVIEGGGTASAVINKMKFTRLVPLYQFQQGVIRMRVENVPGLNLTLKPGSYHWPETVWKI